MVVVNGTPEAAKLAESVLSNKIIQAWGVYFEWDTERVLEANTSVLQAIRA